jgi:thymidylate synthase
MIPEYTHIVNAWNQLKTRTVAEGYDQKRIERGSFENTETSRQQLPVAACSMSDPLNFLYLPKTVTVGAIEQYYNRYVVGCEREENEKYTYGERIVRQLEAVLEMLRKTPLTNQATIAVEQPSDIFLTDPPCLRSIALNWIPVSGLQLTSFWRSNDLSEAFLWNQGSMSMLLRDAAEYADLKPFRLVYLSSGTHIYDYGV